MKAVFLLGRVAFGGFFLYSGVHHFLKGGVMAQYAGMKSVPMPRLSVYATGTALVAGGASLLLGVKPKLGAAAVVTFLAGVSPIMHDFWNEQDAGQKQNSMIHFSKNMALLGAALAMLSLDEPWPVSLPIDAQTPVRKLQKVVRSLAA